MREQTHLGTVTTLASQSTLLMQLFSHLNIEAYTDALNQIYTRQRLAKYERSEAQAFIRGFNIAYAITH